MKSDSQSAGFWASVGAFFTTDEGAPLLASRFWPVVQALAIHLCIGQVYAFSVLALPMGKAFGWPQNDLSWVFSIAIGVLALSAAFFGNTLSKRLGSRGAFFISGLLFSSGLFVSALACKWGSLEMLFLGYGVLGGLGLGIGYLAPVTYLLKWFPDKKGFASGIAIAGFGAGAIIGAPLATILMGRFLYGAQGSVDPKIAFFQVFATLSALCAVAMCGAALCVKANPWDGNDYKKSKIKALSASEAMGSTQFVLLWLIAFLFISAGMGILSQAAALFNSAFSKSADIWVGTAGFVTLLSVCNVLGRFFWPWMSDFIGRKNVYFAFGILGGFASFGAAWAMNGTSLEAFFIFFGIIIAIVGGCFATLPSYVSDLFGAESVSAVYGSALTSWALAGVAGPALFAFFGPSDAASCMSLLGLGFILSTALNAALKPMRRAKAGNEIAWSQRMKAVKK